MSVEQDHRHRPRRRGAVLEEAIRVAVLAELNESGYAGLSIEAVARRAGVGKASLYRRWPTKARLVTDAISRMLPDAASLVDTGSLRGDLVAALEDVASRLAGPAGAALRGLFGDALSDAATSEEVRSASTGRGVEVIRELVRRAGCRGELDPDAVTSKQLEVGHAMVRHQFLLRGGIPRGFVAELVDEVLLPVLGARTGAE